MQIKLWILKRNILDHLTVRKQMSSGSFKNNVAYKLIAYKSYMIYIEDFVLVNLEMELFNHLINKFV